MMSIPPVKSRCLSGMIAGFMFGLIVIVAGMPGKARAQAGSWPAIPSPVTAADQERAAPIMRKFQQGKVREAARELRQLIDVIPDKAVKAYLLRDLAEICLAALDDSCVMKAFSEAEALIAADATLKPLKPDLIASLYAIEVWRGDVSEFIKIEKTYRLDQINPNQYPSALALANLATGNFMLRYDKQEVAEMTMSTAVLGLLMTDRSREKDICRILIGLISIAFDQGDIAGALRLTTVAAPYLKAHLDHRGADWAEYIYLAAQLAAQSDRQGGEALLAEAAKLSAALDIHDDIKLSRVSISIGLLSLLAVSTGDVERAAKLHAANPFQNYKDIIIRRGVFETTQEFYFGVADVLIQYLQRTGGEQAWAPLFAAIPERWQLFGLRLQDAESYRNFARSLIVGSGKRLEAAVLLEFAAWQRIRIFEEKLKERSEGFQLPSAIDRFIVIAALSDPILRSSAGRHDMILQASEMLLRTLRHQLSDLAVLLGAQQGNQGREQARAFYLQQQKKRDWELREIDALLHGRSRDVFAVIDEAKANYFGLQKLRAAVRPNADYVSAIGYPKVKQLQAALNDDEIFVTYAPILGGTVRLCVSKTGSVEASAQYDVQQHRSDIKLLRLALTADDAPDEAQDAQFPAAAAVRLRHYLFGGLEKCMKRGAHVNVALPPEMAGIPLAALLEKEPPARAEGGYELTAAKWLGKSYSFSAVISARHFLGLKRLAGHQPAPRPYLGVGDPDLAPAAKVALAGADARLTLRASGSSGRLQDLPALPETAEELNVARKLFGAAPTDVLTGRAATEKAFVGKDPGAYDIIHFATHGLLKGEVDGLSEPALVLSPVDAKDIANDGLLSASDISRLSLNARLVVLSACNTAKIDTSNASLGVTDLQAAFAVAGTPTMVAALWPVETGTARDLMTGFFQAWQRQPVKSASRALAQATRGYLDHADRAHQHPRFWATFVVMGYGDALTPATAPTGAR